MVVWGAREGGEHPKQDSGSVHPQSPKRQPRTASVPKIHPIRRSARRPTGSASGHPLEKNDFTLRNTASPTHSSQFLPETGTVPLHISRTHTVQKTCNEPTTLVRGWSDSPIRDCPEIKDMVLCLLWQQFLLLIFYYYFLKKNNHCMMYWRIPTELPTHTKRCFTNQNLKETWDEKSRGNLCLFFIEIGTVLTPKWKTEVPSKPFLF